MPGAREHGIGRAKKHHAGWVIVLLGRTEAARLCLNPILLASVVISLASVWWNSRSVVPQWWVWDVKTGTCLLVIAGAVLVAVHLAAGRVRRDDAGLLYASYPTSAYARMWAHVLGLVGPLLVTAVLVAGTVTWVSLLAPVGVPRLSVLAQGLLLVALGGAIGLALGSWLPHPMAGVLAVIVAGAAEADLVFPLSAPIQLPGGMVWLFPWNQPSVLAGLPGPTAAIPPTSHLAWLTALIALAITAALWRVAPRRRLVALVAIGFAAAAGWSGWTQTRPVPDAQANLIYQATHPGRLEQCVNMHGIRYCAYPGFEPDVTRWAEVVDRVLSRLPDHSKRVLVVRQVVDANFELPPLYVGYQFPFALALRLSNELAKFQQSLHSDSHLIAGSSVPPVYVDTEWGSGSMVGPYQLSLAMQAAWWAVGLPTTQRIGTYASGNSTVQFPVSCLAAGQAREAIAIWLAASDTPAARAAFNDGLALGYSPGKVGSTWIAVSNGVPLTAVGGYAPTLRFTSQGAALAVAMLKLPESRVEAVLAARWPGWLRPQVTDADLAAALGIRLPAAPPPPPLHGTDLGQPASPVCR